MTIILSQYLLVKTDIKHRKHCQAFHKRVTQIRLKFKSRGILLQKHAQCRDVRLNDNQWTEVK
jgi:hypothetical protein